MIVAHLTLHSWSGSMTCGNRTPRGSQTPISRDGKAPTIFRACQNSKIFACESCRSLKELVNPSTLSLIWGSICRPGLISIRPAHRTKYITTRIVTSAVFITLVSKRLNVATSFSEILELLRGCSPTLRHGQRTSPPRKFA